MLGQEAVCRICNKTHSGACPVQLSKGRRFINWVFYIEPGKSASEQFIHNMRRNEFALLNYIKLFFLSALKLPQLFGKQVEEFFMAGVGSYIFTGIVLGFTVFEVFWTSRKLYRAKNKNIELKFDVGLSYASSAMFIGLSIGAIILPAVMQVVLTYATVGFVLFMMFRSAFSLILEARIRAKALEEGKHEVAAIYKENIWHHSLMVFGSLAVAALFIVFLTVPVASWPIFVTLAVLGVAYPLVCFFKGARMHNSHKANIKASQEKATLASNSFVDNDSNCPTKSTQLGDARKKLGLEFDFDKPNTGKLLTTLSPLSKKDPQIGFWQKTLARGVRFYDHVERKKQLFSVENAETRWAIFRDRVVLKARKITERIGRIQTPKKPDQLALAKQETRLAFLKDLLRICFEKGPEGTGVLGGESAIQQLKALASLSEKPYQKDVDAKKYAEKKYLRSGILDSEYHHRSECEALRKAATTLLRQEINQIPYEIYSETTRKSVEQISLVTPAA